MKHIFQQSNSPPNVPPKLFFSEADKTPLLPALGETPIFQLDPNGTQGQETEGSYNGNPFGLRSPAKSCFDCSLHRWDRWQFHPPIGSIYHLYTTYSPCLLGGYMLPTTY